MENFKYAYKKAYEHIEPSPNYLDSIMDKMNEKSKKRQHMFLSIMRPVATGCAIMLILSMTVLPVMAKAIPTVYNIVEKYAPALADFIVPTQMYDTSHGITMQVEAIKIEDKRAEIIVSCFDAEGSGENLIHGKVDMYDSYHLQSYGASYNTGGCHFLEYDELEDKAYFKIDLSTDGEYDKGKLQFSVHQLLTNDSEEKKWITLDNIVRNPATKAVSLNGLGGTGNRDIFGQYIEKFAEDSPLSGSRVMDIQKADESMAEALTVTGVGYADGILRIQTCRGNFADADRHMQPFLVDSEGNERHNDFSLMWQEEVNGERLLFDEHWFLVEESELDKIQLYGIFHIIDGSIKGDWKVTLQIE